VWHLANVIDNKRSISGCSSVVPSAAGSGLRSGWILVNFVGRMPYHGHQGGWVRHFDFYSHWNGEAKHLSPAKKRLSYFPHSSHTSLTLKVCWHHGKVGRQHEAHSAKPCEAPASNLNCSSYYIILWTGISSSLAILLVKHSCKTAP